MNKFCAALILAVTWLSASAQVPPTPAANQAAFLKSADPNLARNKKLVYDYWREVVAAGHVEFADKYMAENWIEHNPNIAGRDAMLAMFGSRPKKEILSTIPRLVSMVAEGDLVVLAETIAKPIDPADKTKTYTTTTFDMFRIEHGKIAEHWDNGTRM